MLDSVLKAKVIAGETKSKDDQILERIEFEMGFQKEAATNWMNFEMLKEFGSIEELASYTTVCDLLLIENANGFENYSQTDIEAMMNKVHCPIAVLPDKVEHDSIVIVNDSSLDIVKLTKSFLNLFRPELRELPVSVFVDTPENDSHILNERAFIDYLKLYFKNMGIQLMDCGAASCVQDFINKENLHPILLINSESLKDFANQSIFKSGPLESSITFVVKSNK